MSRVLRIAILAHSTNPRGGVVHALELGDALTRLGHEATVYAPDARGKGFFRSTLCRTACVVTSSVGSDVTAMVETRIADYLRYFEPAPNRNFDVWHAQDGISGNALATLKERGLIAGFARTVHHVDTFEDAPGYKQPPSNPKHNDHEQRPAAGREYDIAQAFPFAEVLTREQPKPAGKLEHANQRVVLVAFGIVEPAVSGLGPARRVEDACRQ